MKTIVLMLVAMLLVVVPTFAAEQPQPAPMAPATTVSADEITSLRAEIAELKGLIASLQAAQPKRAISIGVMPIERAGMIPQVGDSFRQVLISALNEAGIRAVESLDDETLNWVRRQDQLVREGWVSPLTAPRRGELEGVTHYLLATVTRYEEQDVEDEKVLFGILVVKMGGGLRIRTGSLVVDFRLVDATSGIALDSFRTEANVQEREWAGGAAGSAIVGRRRHVWPLPEQAARAVAQQAAGRIAVLVNPGPPKPVLPLAPTAAR